LGPFITRTLMTHRPRSLFFLVGCAALAAGCAGTQSHLRLLESGGAIRVDVADDKSYDYKVLIENRVDFGWDGGDKEDRMKTVQLMFGERCRDVKVLEEVPIEKGTYLTGKPAVTWVMKVKCER
jgi:hypothetical protein